MNAELSEQFMRILSFSGGALLSFFLLMNADAIVNFTDGALLEWNAYIVAAHLMVAVGCGIALFISPRPPVGETNGATRPATGRWLIAVLLAPLVVNLLSRWSASSVHLDQDGVLGGMAYGVIALASLPIVAIAATAAAWQQKLRHYSRQDGSWTSAADSTDLTSVTAGGAIVGLAFYTLLVQPDAYFTDMLYFAWVSYAVLFMAPASVLTVVLPCNPAPSLTDAGSSLSVLRSQLRKDAARVLLFGAVPSFLMIAVQPALTSALPSVGHAYVLPLAVAAFALAVGFARPPRLVEKIAVSAAVWMSVVGVLIFAVSIYIHRYGSSVACGYLLVLFGISCASYMRLAGSRPCFERLCLFYLIASAGALIGATLAELGNLALDKLTFPIGCAVIFICFVGQRITANEQAKAGGEKPA
ncbi:MAG TPA: hypothetical protein V6C69_22690 [Trichormus sp.]|jgi:hypothetical protein